MNETIGKGHPEQDDLAMFAAGYLRGPAADDIAEHLQVCVLCRLEVLRLQRFEAAEADPGLCLEADLDAVGPALDRALATEILPLIRPAGRMRGVSRWPVVTALAATLVMALLGIGRIPGPEVPGGARAPLRGTGLQRTVVMAVQPSGKLTAPPPSFAWTAPDSLDAFALEIFTPDLKIIFTARGIKAHAYVVGDSLASLLAPGATYLWNVKGFSGLKPGPASPDTWFTIPSREHR